ncbi:MAG TPA: MgtC/SapB family protein [Fimbriimonadales bacterium]|nr:MgtC/SapB family protein [Fimbriimonadales bacterium]
MQSFEALLEKDSLLAAFEILLKLGIAAILSGIVGWEREIHGRPAGIRTHMLVCIGVVIFGEVSKSFPTQDPSRIAAQIVTGIGFLGAGTILRTGGTVLGLTTAASLWAVSGIGLAVSTGGYFYWVAVFGTILCLLTLTVVNQFEKFFAKDTHTHDLIVIASSRDIVLQIVPAIEKLGGKLSSIKIEDAEGGVRVSLSIRGARERILETISSMGGVLSATWGEHS